MTDESNTLPEHEPEVVNDNDVGALFNPVSIAIIDSLRAQIATLKALLREMEWVHDDVDYEYGACPVCGPLPKASRGRSHEPDCRLAAALQDPSATATLPQATEEKSP